MKPESIKYVLGTFLKERLQSLSSDDPDGYKYQPIEKLSGETVQIIHDKASDMLYIAPMPPNVPWNELNAHLEQELAIIAAGIGRQLSQMSDEFDSDDTDVINNQTSANGVQFREHAIRVSPNSGKVQIIVIRAEPAKGEVKISWRTSAVSAQPGVHYVNGEGNISFTEGEKEKTIEVEIIEDPKKKTDIDFIVELFNDEGPFNTLKIYIVDDSTLYPEEQLVIDNIFRARHISLNEIATRLADNVTHNTFKAALQCLCGNAETLSKELVLASELLRLTIPHARFSTLTNVFYEYFSSLPELEELATMF